MTFIDVQLHNLFEQLIQCLIRMSDNQRALFGPVVIDVRNDLYRDIRLARTRRANNLKSFPLSTWHAQKRLIRTYHCQSWLHTRSNRFDLNRCEPNRILFRNQIRVWSSAGNDDRLDDDFLFVRSIAT